MDNKSREEKALASLCEKCGGRCCMGHHIVLSRQEFLSLKKLKDFPQGRIDSPTGVGMVSIDALSPGRCPFLEDKTVDGVRATSCILEGVMRPLVCRMFPLTFVLEEGRKEFFLSRKCPYANEVSLMHEWIASTVSSSEQELAASWSGRELRCLGVFLRKGRDELIGIRV